MLKMLTIFLSFMSVFHLWWGMDPNGLVQGLQAGEYHGRQRRRAQRLFGQNNRDSQEVAVRRQLRFVTPDAAIGLYSEGVSYVFLFIGNQVQVLKDRNFFEEKPRTDFHLPDDMHLQAAFVRQGNADNKLYYGDKYGLSVSVRDKVKKRKLKYGRARAFIRDGGPDAAARRAGKVYVFKGCEVAVRNGWNDWGKPVNVTTLGLPCDVDAAWNENGVMVIMKGDLIWRWHADNTVDDAYPFVSFYRLKIGDAPKP